MIVYIEDGKYYVEAPTAYALGITRNINGSDVIELPLNVHDNLRKNPDMDIQYIKRNKSDSLVSSNNRIDNNEKKESNNLINKNVDLQHRMKINIYEDNGKYYVEHSAAFALGLIEVRSIMLDNPNYVELPEDIHTKLKNE